MNDIQLPDESGHFAQFGGRYVPETVMGALEELEASYKEVCNDPGFQGVLQYYLGEYVGRPTPLYFAEKLTRRWRGARIYLKREDLNHTGAHKINNCLGQALLTQRMGKERIIAETGAGQHGVATATAAALFGIPCDIYMGATDIERQALNVFRMRLLGANVISVEAGSRTLKDAINEAMRDWVTHIRTTHYILGSVVGPHPYPMLVRDFQSVIGRETRQQILEKEGRLPDYCIACVGGGSNSIGMFHPFLSDAEVRLVGVEAAGMGADGEEHALSLCRGTVGVLHGSKSYLLQDENGLVTEAHSISAGLDYPGVGPEHSFLKSTGRAEYVGVTDEEALDAFQLLSQEEGIIPALETAHAVAHAASLAPRLSEHSIIVICLSGRGDKDSDIVADALGVDL